MRAGFFLLIASFALASCAEAPADAAPVQVSWDELNEMVEAFGYEQGIRQFCEDPGATGQDQFLAELEATPGVDADLLARAKTRAAEVQGEFDAADPEEEQEYVCTVEMFVGSETRADLARQKWAELKGASE